MPTPDSADRKTRPGRPILVAVVLGLTLSMPFPEGVLTKTADAASHLDRASSHPSGTATFVRKALAVPRDNDPWRLIIRFDDGYDHLAMPREADRLGALPATIRDQAQERVRMRSSNLAVLGRTADELDGLLRRTHLSRQPEYLQSLGEVAIALHLSDATLANPLERHEPVLRALPPYTVVDLFVPESLAGRVEARLKILRLPNRVRILPARTGETAYRTTVVSGDLNRWSRDAFSVARDDMGHQYVLAPLGYDQAFDLAHADNDYLATLDAPSRRVVRVPLFFRGGNLLVGESGGRRILFVGEREIRDNQAYFFNAFSYWPAARSIAELLRVTAGASKVEVMPEGPHFGHVDMMFSFLDKGVAAVLQPADGERLAPADAEALDEARRRLVRLGFRIVPIPTTAAWVSAYMAPVNIVPFRNRVDHGRYALVPEFPDVTVQWHGRAVSIREHIQATYISAGVNPIFVEDRFHTVQGNTHCSLTSLD